MQKRARSGRCPQGTSCKKANRQAGCEIRGQCTPHASWATGCQELLGQLCLRSAAADPALWACPGQDPALPGTLGTRILLPRSSSEDGMTRESPVHLSGAGNPLNQGMARSPRCPQGRPTSRGSLLRVRHTLRAVPWVITWLLIPVKSKCP